MLLRVKELFKVRVRVGWTRVSKTEGVSEVRTLLVTESEVVTISLYESVSEIKNSLSESLSEVMSEYVRGKVTWKIWTNVDGNFRRTVHLTAPDD